MLEKYVSDWLKLERENKATDFNFQSTPLPFVYDYQESTETKKNSSGVSIAVISIWISAQAKWNGDVCETTL